MKKLILTMTLMIFLTAIFGFVGQAQRARVELDPIVPAIASFVIPGGGQLLNDQPNKAVTHFVVSLGIYAAVYAYPSPIPMQKINIALTAHLAWSAYSAYDAYIVARNRYGGRIMSMEGIQRPSGALKVSDYHGGSSFNLVEIKF